MDKEWGNVERVQTIQQALTIIPHNQIAVGVGFGLTHAPDKCLRCRAEISLLELSTIVQSEVSNVA